MRRDSMAELLIPHVRALFGFRISLLERLRQPQSYQLCDDHRDVELSEHGFEPCERCGGRTTVHDVS